MFVCLPVDAAKLLYTVVHVYASFLKYLCLCFSFRFLSTHSLMRTQWWSDENHTLQAKFHKLRFFKRTTIIVQWMWSALMEKFNTLETKEGFCKFTLALQGPCFDLRDRKKNLLSASFTGFVLRRKCIILNKQGLCLQTRCWDCCHVYTASHQANKSKDSLHQQLNATTQFR